MKALPIADKVIKDFHGRTVNFVEKGNFTFGKELQLHVMEFKSNKPFRSPVSFEETMYSAVLTILDFLERKYDAMLLGTGMHPLLKLEETGVWPHRHRQIYQAYGRIFNLKQHGWLNIQSFHLNLPYFREDKAVLTHNILANICAYLPAVSASSPIYEGKIGEYVDNRLLFYMINQKEVPSIAGNVIPEYVSSFKQYRHEIIQRYSSDLAKAGADKCLLNKEWVNSRAVVFRFERKALEIRVMDEQECIKSDVALSCFIRALLRGFYREEAPLLPTETLVKDFKSVIKEGLAAPVSHPKGENAKKVMEYFLKIAQEHSSPEEREYLWIIKQRMEKGNLSEIIKKEVLKRAQKTTLHEAILDVYLKLLKSLRDNKPFL